MAIYDPLNPIRYVDAAYVPTPSAYAVEYNDISAPEAGRTEDGNMHKLRVGTARKITLEWANVTASVGAELMRLFQPEYISVAFLDPRLNSYVSAQFYVGDRSVKMYSNALGTAIMTVSFNLIERAPFNVVNS